MLIEAGLCVLMKIFPIIYPFSEQITFLYSYFWAKDSKY